MIRSGWCSVPGMDWKGIHRRRRSGHLPDGSLCRTHTDMSPEGWYNGHHTYSFCTRQYLQQWIQLSFAYEVFPTKPFKIFCENFKFVHQREHLPIVINYSIQSSRKRERTNLLFGFITSVPGYYERCLANLVAFHSFLGRSALDDSRHNKQRALGRIYLFSGFY